MLLEEWLGRDNTLGNDICSKKYIYEGESFDEFLDRVSGNGPEIRQLMEEQKFLFGGRILSNRGLHKKGFKVTYSNCYVISPPEDNIESIFDCAKNMARTYSYGGGCGIDISKLAPNGSIVNNTAKQTSGSVSFMDLYSLTTGLIGQNGRRGALMISLACDHPDIEDFIKIKSDLNRITKANISVRISDDFMKKVKNREMHRLYFKRSETGEEIVKDIDAHTLFKKMAYMNWDYAEPGMLFWDRIDHWNLLSNTEEFSYAGTNPCAEEPLPAGGSCLLGSLNLAAFVHQEKGAKGYAFDFESFKKAVEISVRALDNVLDEGLPLHPLKEQQDSVRDWRQIGLGIFGLADMLIRLGIRYGSKESIKLSDKIGFMLADTAIRTSSLLAKELGKFPKCNIKEIMSTEYFQANTTAETRKIVEQNGLRNSQLLTIAPTGSLSTMLGVSGGIEPIFANFYERKTESLHGHDQYYKVYTPIVQNFMEEHGLTDDSELPNYFVTAQNLDYRQRIDMQATWQKHLDASISSTVNVPQNFSVQEVEDLYMYAWEQGIKGITIFRDGCQRSGILTTETKKPEKTHTNKLGRGYILQVNDDVIGKKRKLMTGCGSLHCTGFFDPETGDLLEIYLNKGSTGGCNNFMIALSRMISLSARSGCSVDVIKDQLDSCGACPSYAVRSATKHDTSIGSCCPVAIGNALVDMYNDMMEELYDREADDEYDKENILEEAFIDEFEANFHAATQAAKTAKETIVDSKPVGKKTAKNAETTEAVTLTLDESSFENLIAKEKQKVEARHKRHSSTVVVENEFGEKDICPVCSNSLVREMGCKSCKFCGFSACD